MSRKFICQYCLFLQCWKPFLDLAIMVLCVLKDLQLLYIQDTSWGLLCCIVLLSPSVKDCQNCQSALRYIATGCFAEAIRYRVTAQRYTVKTQLSPTSIKHVYVVHQGIPHSLIPLCLTLYTLQFNATLTVSSYLNCG